MSNKTVIKYNTEGMRMFKLPIISIYPEGDINIKITFPDSEDININTNQNVIIKQGETEPYPCMNLYLNGQIISTKKHFYNNGTIIISGACYYNESFEMYYDS